VILHCSYEEMTAVRAGARVALAGGEGHPTAVAAPPSVRPDLDRLTSTLDGDLTLSTLDDQRVLERALQSVVAALRVEMEVAVVASHPAAEPAVSAYFEFAHALSLLERVRTVGAEMAALIEVVTGEPPTEESSRTFVFPD
jgi:hypothetical protein